MAKQKIKVVPEDKEILEYKLMYGSTGNVYIDFKDKKGGSHLLKINKKNNTFIYNNIKYTIVNEGK